MIIEPLYGSYRDPSGFVFCHEGSVYRAIRSAYKPQFDHLIASGLADELHRRGLLINHTDVTPLFPLADNISTVLLPEQVPFISYPWEWTFHQLKDAAILTLEIQQIALDHGMILKDASSLNIQFVRGRPVFIDTLSFDFYVLGKPWVAYRQFCEYFLGPVAVMGYVDSELGSLTQFRGGNIPLSQCVHLLGKRGTFNFGVFMHLRMHDLMRRRVLNRNGGAPTPQGSMSKESLLGLVHSLKHSVKKIKPRQENSDWHSYYSTCQLGAEYLKHKEAAILELVRELRPTSILDFGANRGTFSKLAAAKGIPVVACDADRASIDSLYLEIRASDEKNLLPLVVDLCNPTPPAGWMNKEFLPFIERAKADLGLALALIHHLAIGRNLPFAKIAEMFHHCCNSLIIEFVTKDDPNVRIMLQGRTDIFTDYTQGGFEKAFGRVFKILRKIELGSSTRTLYRMEKIP
jgi:SAM-dependent methyltransferase